MEREHERGQTFTRRAFVIAALQGGLLAVLGGRLAWLQVVQGNRYQMLADNNRINIRMLAPSRGQIVDRNGVLLATNAQNFRILMVPEQTDDIAASLSALQKLVPLSQRDIQRVIKQAERSASFVPLEVRDNLEWEEVATVEVNLPDLPGLSIDEGEIRHYPLGDAVAHLTGYVGAVNKAELKPDDPLLSLPGFRIGKTGAEKTFDAALRGTAGTAEMEINVLGREVRELNRNPAKPGERVMLTIDAELQKYVQDRLKQVRSASAAILDAHTGAVYAMVSHPSFDPNMFTRGISADKWEELLADPGLPLNNKAIGGQYPPGSTFKMVTAMAALEEKIVGRNTTFFCPGHFDFGDSRFHCWKRGGHGYVDVVGALTQSCDTYFYNVATQMGIDTLTAYAKRLGLGEKFGFELSEERPGLMPTKAWKMGQFSEPWQPGETIVCSIGQGYLLSTPLQLAVMTARLVNGGKAIKPWLTGFIGDKPGETLDWPETGFKKAHENLILRGMVDVVNSQRGTAYASRMEDEQFQMGGKTGTAQVRRISREDRLEGVQNEDLPWKYRHHALFVGFAPIGNPRYTCCVVVEHGVGGSVAAAPIARDILLMAQQRDPAATKLGGGKVTSPAAVPPQRKPPEKPQG
jgi:penicillin-binding protein 2